MNKILKLSLVIIYLIAWLLATYILIEELVTRPENLFTIDLEMNDYSLLVPFLVFLLGIPSVIFLVIKDRQVKNETNSLSGWQKLFWISNFGLGIIIIYFSIEIFIIVQENFPVKEFPNGWKRYLIGLGFIVFGAIIIYQNFRENLATTKSKDY